MSLTSYRAAPPRAKDDGHSQKGGPKTRKGSTEWRIDIVYSLFATPHSHIVDKETLALCRPGDDLLSQVLRHSTIGAEAFDGRVRDGIGSDRSAEATRPAKGKFEANCDWSFDRAIWEDGHGLMRTIKPIELLVPVSSARCRASTPGLSTWSSSTALEGELVSRWVSRLDAFSGYPVHT